MKKLGANVVLSRELVESSNGETVVETLLKEDIATSLDAAVFSNAAATSSKPAGILNGVAALTATTGGGENALRGDLALVGGAVAAATGNGDGIAFIASPAYAIRFGTYKAVIGDTSNLWASLSVPDGTLIAVQTKAFVSAFGSTPRIRASKEATLHMDTAPVAIGTPATPNVVAAPASSMFQIDSIAVQAVLDVAYALRASGAVAWLQSATW